MAVNDRDKDIKSVIKYSAYTRYFGHMSGADLNRAYNKFHMTEFNDGTSIIVGNSIGNDMICRVLWKQMSYNPVRFGTVSPFGNPPNVYKFVRNGVPQTHPGYDVLQSVRGILWDYLRLNAQPNGRWDAEIPTVNGMIYVMDATDRKYRALCCLRKCVKTIANQNMHDYQIAEYRDGIIAAVNEMRALAQRRADMQRAMRAPQNTETPAGEHGNGTDLAVLADDRESELLSTITPEHDLGANPDDFAEYIHRMTGHRIGD